MVDALLALTDSSLRHGRAEASDWLDARGALRVEAVPSPVTTVAIARALKEGHYQGFVIIGHGGPDGVRLDDEGGALLDYPTLAPLVRGQLEWLFLNTCESQEVADKIAAMCGVIVLCTVSAVDDRAAYTTGSAVAKALDEGLAFWEAVMRVKPEAVRGWKLALPQMPQEPPLYGANFCLWAA